MNLELVTSCIEIGGKPVSFSKLMGDLCVKVG